MKDFAWYAGEDIVYERMKPTKPYLSRNPTGDEARQYADLLDIYEKESEEYRNEYKKYKEKLAERNSAFKTDLFKEAMSAWVNSSVFNVIYDKAYEDAHDSGFEGVYDKFWEITDFIEQVWQAMR
jgi:hypothetical protein